jgi:hypothetical protein
MSGTTAPPLVLTPSGPVPTPPATLNAMVIAQAAALAPGYTVLPAGLIEDLSSTATGALVVIDQARVDLIDSLSPYSANPYLLNQLGQLYGVPQGSDTNTAVNVVFSGTGIVGYVVRAGFTVSDGTFQYVIQEPVVIGASGNSLPVTAVATQTGSWAIPAGTVNALATSVPTTISNPSTGTGLTVTNPFPGTPSEGPQTEADYRSQVTQAGLVAATGSPTMLKTLLGNVPGVVANLVSVRQQTGGGWEIIVGGAGDPNQIGFAIYQALFDVSTLVGSILAVSGITNANPAVVTTDLNHGYATGQSVVMSGATGLTVLNNQTLTATVLSPTTFSVPVNTATAGTYTGNGVMSPNFRNTSVSIFDYPDTYTIPYVLPPTQTVTMVVTWNTIGGSAFVSAASVAAAVQAAIVVYLTQLPVGQPINILQLNATFLSAVSGLIPNPALLTTLTFAISINGIGVLPEVGTDIIQGDPESSFTATTAGIVVNQG